MQLSLITIVIGFLAGTSMAARKGGAAAATTGQPCKALGDGGVFPGFCSEFGDCQITQVANSNQNVRLNSPDC